MKSKNGSVAIITATKPDKSKVGIMLSIIHDDHTISKELPSFFTAEDVYYMVDSFELIDEAVEFIFKAKEEELELFKILSSLRGG